MRGNIDPGDLSFRPRVVGVVEIRKDSRFGDGQIILPRCGGNSTLARGGTLAARWLLELQPISNQPMRARGTDSGDMRFRPRLVGVVEIYFEEERFRALAP